MSVQDVDRVLHLLAQPAPASSPEARGDVVRVAYSVPGKCVRVVTVPRSHIVTWHDQHMKWDSVLRFRDWYRLMACAPACVPGSGADPADCAAAQALLQRAVMDLSSKTANSSTHACRSLVTGAATLRSLQHATSAVELVMASADFSHIAAARRMETASAATSAAQRPVAPTGLRAQQMRAERRGKGVGRAAGAGPAQQGAAAGGTVSGTVSGTRNVAAARHAVAVLTSGSLDTAFCEAWGAIAHTPLEATRGGIHSSVCNAAVDDSQFETWVDTWTRVVQGDAAAVGLIKFAALLNEGGAARNNLPPPLNGAVEFITHSLRKPSGEWPLRYPPSRKCMKSIPVPLRTFGAPVHIPALALLHVCSDPAYKSQRKAAAVWYAAWGHRLVSFKTMLVQLYRVAASPPFKTSPRALLDLVKPIVEAAPPGGAAAGLARPLSTAGGRNSTLISFWELLHGEDPSGCRTAAPAWWWNPRAPHPVARDSRAFVANYARAAYSAMPDSADSCHPFSEPQRHASVLCSAADVLWSVQAWDEAASVVAGTAYTGRGPDGGPRAARATVLALLGKSAADGIGELVAPKLGAGVTQTLLRVAQSTLPLSVFPCPPRAPNPGMHMPWSDDVQERRRTALLAIRAHDRARGVGRAEWVKWQGDSNATVMAQWLNAWRAFELKQQGKPHRQCVFHAVPLLLTWPLHDDADDIAFEEDIVSVFTEVDRFPGTSSRQVYALFSGEVREEAKEALEHALRSGVRCVVPESNPSPSVHLMDSAANAWNRARQRQVVHAQRGGEMQPPGPPDKPLHGPPASYVVGPLKESAVRVEMAARGVLFLAGINAAHHDWDECSILVASNGIFLTLPRGMPANIDERAASSWARRNKTSIRGANAVVDLRRGIGSALARALRGQLRGTGEQVAAAEKLASTPRGTFGVAADGLGSGAGGVGWVWGNAAGYPHLAPQLWGDAEESGAAAVAADTTAFYPATKRTKRDFSKAVGEWLDMFGWGAAAGDIELAFVKISTR